MRKKIVSLILEKDGKFLIEKRKSTRSTDPGKILFPGGHVNDGESLDDAINRETKEELGIEIIDYKLVHSADFETKGESQTLYWFWCKKFRGEIEKNEADEYIWIKPNEGHKLSYQVSRDALSSLLRQKG